MTTSSQSPTVQRRRLRSELRAERARVGQTQQQVASEMDWSLSRLIRIDQGDVGISANDPRTLLQLHGVSHTVGVPTLQDWAPDGRRRSLDHIDPEAPPPLVRTLDHPLATMTTLGVQATTSSVLMVALSEECSAREISANMGGIPRTGEIDPLSSRWQAEPGEGDVAGLAAAHQIVREGPLYVYRGGNSQGPYRARESDLGPDPIQPVASSHGKPYGASVFTSLEALRAAGIKGPAWRQAVSALAPEFEIYQDGIDAGGTARRGHGLLVPTRVTTHGAYQSGLFVVRLWEFVC
jgi:transcriptional regulator with XRE-family HTH domain